MVAFIINNPSDRINPSKTLRMHNQVQICSDASEKNLIFISHVHEAFGPIPNGQSQGLGYYAI